MSRQVILYTCLLLASCGSGSQKDYSIKVFAVNVPCSFAEQVTQGVAAVFADAGIALITDLHCVEWGKSYGFGDRKKALAELSAEFGEGHFLVPKFDNYFDGYQAGSSSISVAVVGRLRDSVNQATHEILHQFGASHNFDSCNIMGYYRLCDNPPILESTLREIK